MTDHSKSVLTAAHLCGGTNRLAALIGASIFDVTRWIVREAQPSAAMLARILEVVHMSNQAKLAQLRRLKAAKARSHSYLQAAK
jgi:hypothetical protein